MAGTTATSGPRRGTEAWYDARAARLMRAARWLSIPGAILLVVAAFVPSLDGGMRLILWAIAILTLLVAWVLMDRGNAASERARQVAAERHHVHAVPVEGRRRGGHNHPPGRRDGASH